MNLGKMEVSLPSDTEIEVTREFDAPRRLVFDAHIKPELVKRWLHGPDEWPLHEVDIDARPGGRLRYVWRSEKTGADMVLRGEYKEIVPPERIVHTELFDEDWTGGETIVTTRFAEAAGKTLMTMTIVYSSREARDGALKSGMNEGMEQAYARLDGMLAKAAL
jgi:uncharacterized protein YndB with AHSA1/START domain